LDSVSTAWRAFLLEPSLSRFGLAAGIKPARIRALEETRPLNCRPRRGEVETKDRSGIGGILGNANCWEKKRSTSLVHRNRFVFFSMHPP
jgi:hypothetical protein